MQRPHIQRTRGRNPLPALTGPAVILKDQRKHRRDDAQALIRNADTAMYHAKANGRANYKFFTEPMNAAATKRLHLESELWRALADNQLLLHYQPQIDLLSGKVVGVEALVRWRHPQRGLVGPAEFIPVAEVSGLIVMIGEWVLGEACRQNCAWQQAGLPAISIAVNISAVQFRSGRIEDNVAAVLADTGLAPELLELELTEGIVMVGANATVETLQRISDMGVKLAIDDFGTGYSSLAYLKKLPIHKLKIDQSFVRGLPDDDGDRAIVSAIISMGRAMHIEVVAEGVETETQQAVLQQMQCEHYQGFLCAPGLPTDQFRALLSKPLPLKAQGRHRPLNT